MSKFNDKCKDLEQKRDVDYYERELYKIRVLNERQVLETKIKLIDASLDNDVKNTTDNYYDLLVILGLEEYESESK